MSGRHRTARADREARARFLDAHPLPHPLGCLCIVCVEMRNAKPRVAEVIGPTPIPMRLPCPECGELHIDEGAFATKPHHTHACQKCGAVWRPAVVCTVGVRFLPGFLNDPPGDK